MKFLRQLIALWKVYHAPEYGGMLYDYANGKWNQLHVWETRGWRRPRTSLTRWYSICGDIVTLRDGSTAIKVKR